MNCAELKRKGIEEGNTNRGRNLKTKTKKNRKNEDFFFWSQDIKVLRCL